VNTPEMLRPTEVRHLLGCSIERLTYAANAGIFTSFRTLGNARRYYKSEIDNHIEHARAMQITPNEYLTQRLGIKERKAHTSPGEASNA